MTAPAASSPVSVRESRRVSRFVGVVGPALDLFFVCLAIISAANWAFYLWIDLRFAGSVIYFTLPILWVLSVLTIHILIGRAKHPGLIKALLWPTYLLLACAVANTFYFYSLWLQDRVDVSFPFFSRLPPVPLCDIVGAILLVWAYTVRRRAVSSPAGATNRATISGRIFRTAYFLFCIVVCAGFFYLNTYQRPPAPLVERADLAVVLGNRVLPDGRASVVLEDRTLVAVNLYKQRLVRKILVSGQIDVMADGHHESEALAMKEVCLAHGVPERDILVDPLGNNTRATAYNAQQVMLENGYGSIIGVSHAFHLRRVELSFVQLGIACPTVAVDPQNQQWTQADLGVTIREAVGLIVYAANRQYNQPKAAAMNVHAPRIVVTKSKNTLELFDGDVLVKTYACITGSNAGDKQVEGDRKTPLGAFHIVYKNPASKFHLSLGLNYPDEKDAAWALAQKPPLITKEQYDMIVSYSRMTDLSAEAIQKVYWKTPLGGEIFLHGHADGRMGTAGCVALSNADIDELYAVCQLGTPVQIKP